MAFLTKNKSLASKLLNECKVLEAVSFIDKYREKLVNYLVDAGLDFDDTEDAVYVKLPDGTNLIIDIIKESDKVYYQSWDKYGNQIQFDTPEKLLKNIW